MREIKFRAWDKWEKVMLSNIQLHPNFGLLDDERFTKLQYIGLKDKNDEEIYEGDILQLVSKAENPKWEVCWHENAWQMKLIPLKEVHPHNYYVQLSSERVLEFDEVIGNIYENPELLK